MLRTSADPDAAYYAVFVTPEHGVRVQYRQLSGGPSADLGVDGSGPAPAYVGLSRTGNALTAYTSSDGVHWAYIPHSAVALSLGNTALAGLAITSHDDITTGTATVDAVSDAPLAACPTDWTCRDIGDPALAGTQAEATDSGVWAVVGSGSDIWNSADEFHYVWHELAGDGSLSAHLLAQDDTYDWAKAGLMVRQSDDPGSPYYAAMLTPSHGIMVNYRATQGGTTTQLTGFAGTAPVYLKVARSGDVLTTYTSTDGTAWTPVAGSSLVLPLGDTPLWGIAISAVDEASLGAVTVGDVSLSTTAPPAPTTSCPEGWTCADVGGPTPPGSQMIDAGTWTLQGSGADIWGTTDQFRYAWQTLRGDGSLSAHVVAQEDTDEWAKAGIMLRATSGADSPYYAVVSTPDHGVRVQYRATAGGETTDLATGTQAPIYLRITRAGDTYTATTSADGMTWMPVPGSSAMLSLGNAVLAGLAVTPHATRASPVPLPSTPYRSRAQSTPRRRRATSPTTPTIGW